MFLSSSLSIFLLLNPMNKIIDKIANK
jgi:hypothetical protein